MRKVYSLFLFICYISTIFILCGEVLADSKIVFVKNNPDEGDTVWVMNSDGSKQEKITASVGAYSNPAWSPDGEWIAFGNSIYAEVDSGVYLYLMRNDGSDLHPIVKLTNDSMAGVADIKWSIDGNSMYVQLSYHDSPPGELLVGLNGKIISASFDEIKVLFKPFKKYELLKTISPDGKKKLFTEQKGKHSELFVSDMDSKNKIQLSNSANLKRNCREHSCDTSGIWTPDGKRILYIPYDSCGDSCYGDLFVVDVNGKNRKKLLSGQRDFPDDWSPDGKYLLFQDSSGTKIKICSTDFSKTKCVAEGEQPDWSPELTKTAKEGGTPSSKSTSNKKEAVAPKLEVYKPETIAFVDKEFPDGLIGRRYSFVLSPVNAISLYKVTLVTGTLPPGTILNEQTGGIEGEPNQAGVWNVSLRIVDAKGERGTFSGDIRVWRALTVGEHGILKGFDGFQMALNMAQDMDEIRIEKGVYGGTGLRIPENKEWKHGIKISGGWNETFAERSESNKENEVTEIGRDYTSETGRDYTSENYNETGRDYTSESYISEDPEATILDGEKKEERIFNISNSRGEVLIENITFRNSKGGAVQIMIGSGGAIFTNCIFKNNRAYNGGAVYGRGTFRDSVFDYNISISDGGAVYGSGDFTKCIFKNNRAQNSYGFGGGAVRIENDSSAYFTDSIFYNNTSIGDGGAISGVGRFSHCIFDANLARESGGAISGRGDFLNCTFKNNTSKNGGAFHGFGNFNNCVFTNNTAINSGGAINTSSSAGGVSYWGYNAQVACVGCTFTSNSSKEKGGAVNGTGTFTNSIFNNNDALAGEGGAFNGDGTFINSTFYGNEAGAGGAIKGKGSIINSILLKNMAYGKDNDIQSDGNMEIDYSIINFLKGVANYGSKNIMGDPRLVDPDNGNLHLRHDSPAVNTGKIVPELKDITTDLDGKPRMYRGKIDMGAYEWQGETIVESKPPSQSISIDATTGIAIDSTTGLQWAQDAGVEQMTWDEANAYVQKLKIGGYSDWRLPTKEEFELLLSYCKSNEKSVKEGKCAEYYSKIGFKNVGSVGYWSSTTYAGNTDDAWLIAMWAGDVRAYDKSGYEFYVWPVRSGQ